MRNMKANVQIAVLGKGTWTVLFLHLHDKTLSTFQGIHVKTIAIVLIVCPVLVIVEIENHN